MVDLDPGLPVTRRFGAPGSDAGIGKPFDLQKPVLPRFADLPGYRYADLPEVGTIPPNLTPRRADILLPTLIGFALGSGL